MDGGEEQEELREKEEGKGGIKGEENRGSEMRANQNKNSETASENLMDDRSRKWGDRRRLEREGDEILELLEKHEK